MLPDKDTHTEIWTKKLVSDETATWTVGPETITIEDKTSSIPALRTAPSLGTEAQSSRKEYPSTASATMSQQEHHTVVSTEKSLTTLSEQPNMQISPPTPPPPPQPPPLVTTEQINAGPHSPVTNGEVSALEVTPDFYVTTMTNVLLALDQPGDTTASKSPEISYEPLTSLSPAANQQQDIPSSTSSSKPHLTYAAALKAPASVSAFEPSLASMSTSMKRQFATFSTAALQPVTLQPVKPVVSFSTSVADTSLQPSSHTSSQVDLVTDARVNQNSVSSIATITTTISFPRQELSSQDSRAPRFHYSTRPVSQPMSKEQSTVLAKMLDHSFRSNAQASSLSTAKSTFFDATKSTLVEGHTVSDRASPLSNMESSTDSIHKEIGKHTSPPTSLGVSLGISPRDVPEQATDRELTSTSSIDLETTKDLAKVSKEISSQGVFSKFTTLLESTLSPGQTASTFSNDFSTASLVKSGRSTELSSTISPKSPTIQTITTSLQPGGANPRVSSTLSTFKAVMTNPGGSSFHNDYSLHEEPTISATLNDKIIASSTVDSSSVWSTTAEIVSEPVVTTTISPIITDALISTMGATRKIYDLTGKDISDMHTTLSSPVLSGAEKRPVQPGIPNKTAVVNTSESTVADTESYNVKSDTQSPQTPTYVSATMVHKGTTNLPSQRKGVSITGRTSTNQITSKTTERAKPSAATVASTDSIILTRLSHGHPARTKTSRTKAHTMTRPNLSSSIADLTGLTNRNYVGATSAYTINVQSTTTKPTETPITTPTPYTKSLRTLLVTESNMFRPTYMDTSSSVTDSIAPHGYSKSPQIHEDASSTTTLNNKAPSRTPTVTSATTTGLNAGPEMTSGLSEASETKNPPSRIQTIQTTQPLAAPTTAFSVKISISAITIAQSASTVRTGTFTTDSNTSIKPSKVKKNPSQPTATTPLSLPLTSTPISTPRAVNSHASGNQSFKINIPQNCFQRDSRLSPLTVACDQKYQFNNIRRNAPL